MVQGDGDAEGGEAVEGGLDHGGVFGGEGEGGLVGVVALVDVGIEDGMVEGAVKEVLVGVVDDHYHEDLEEEDGYAGERSGVGYVKVGDQGMEDAVDGQSLRREEGGGRERQTL